MDTFIKFIGIVWVAIGVFFLVKPGAMTSLAGFFRQGMRVYAVAVLRLVLAVVFIAGAGQCDITWVILLLGVLLMLSAMLIFLLGPRKIALMLDWYMARPYWLLRVMAAIAVALGAAVIYAT